MQWKLREEMRKPAEQRRLESALGAADAQLVRYEARSDRLTVTYLVDGRECTAIVDRGDTDGGERGDLPRRDGPGIR